MQLAVAGRRNSWSLWSGKIIEEMAGVQTHKLLPDS